jgi:Tfp pilus assembly protein PilF
LHEPKTYQGIMVSSTFTDLEEHRQKVIKAIETLGCKANVMENDGARADADVIDSSLNMVRDSVAYVGVISLKYGQTPFDSERNPDRLSITELEFNEATRLKRPIILFVMGDKHPVVKADVELDPNKMKKLDAFRERAKRMREGSDVNRVYATFESSGQFAAAAAVAVGRLIKYLESSSGQTAEASMPTDKAPVQALTNIPINLPRHFLGREDDLAAIDAALTSSNGRAAITALHGLRGVGKTTLAAAYAERHRGTYRATWWIRAETESTLRADLVGLGVRLGWVAADAAEEPAVAGVLERLRDDGAGILLVYDNAKNADGIRNCLPRGGMARIIVTSNAPDWRGIAAPVAIEVWPKEIGAEYLTARTGRASEQTAALALSEALGGLPLAHEQAAAYCERLGISLAEYRKRFEAAPAKLLDTEKDAPADYHDRLTVAKTFALAIGEAAKRHSAAEPLIAYAALLAPEPIPLYVFSEAREEFGEPLASQLAGDGLDEAVAALRGFALIDREIIPDERNPAITTDCIRLHRLVREVAAARHEPEARQAARRILIAAMVALYPVNVWRDPDTWPRARRLDPLTLALVGGNSALPAGAEEGASNLLIMAAQYKQHALADYAQAKQLYESALAIREKLFGPEHPETATSLHYLGNLLGAQGDLAGARSCFQLDLAISEKALGPDHPDTATSLNNLGNLLRAQGDLVGARPYAERALAIRESVLGPDHPDTATSLNELGGLLQAQGDLAGARPYVERALAIYEKVRGPDHPHTATSLNNLGYLLRAQGDLAGARPYVERALAIRESVLGHDHPDTARSLSNLGGLLRAQGDLAGARPYYARALAICEKTLGHDHPTTKAIHDTLAALDAK